jgi:hypothetical protein
LNQSTPDLKSAEKWWIDRVQDFFSGKPFKLRLDASRSLPKEKQVQHHGANVADAPTLRAGAILSVVIVKPTPV